jgi:cytidylate kinase
MAGELIRLPGYPKAVTAICRCGQGARILKQAESLEISGAYAEEKDEMIAEDEEAQAILKAAGITDDESAIAYMEKVRPILWALNAQVSEIRERCNAEIGNLLSGVTEEFWRSL